MPGVKRKTCTRCFGTFVHLCLRCRFSGPEKCKRCKAPLGQDVELYCLGCLRNLRFVKRLAAKNAG